MSPFPAGLYVHIPFCITRCGYCDFNAYSGLGHMAGAYVAALGSEAEMTASDWKSERFISVFFGGGTPTTLGAGTLVELLGRFRGLYSLASGAEVTCEANPDTVDESYLAAMRRGGMNRLSLGVQSFDPSVLEALERGHSADSVPSVFRAARSAGFDNVSLDLIYGASGESLRSWAETLERAVRLGPEHLSCYALTIEPGTSLGRKVAGGIVPAPDGDLQAAMYDLACEMLASAGYLHYEVSNWAKPGFECLHNRGYWEGRAYLGLGAGAHSYRDGRRWWNLRPPGQYLRAVQAGRLPVGDEERMTQEEQRMERLLLGLRAAGGVPSDWVDPSRAALFVGQGLARHEDGRFALTERGLVVANEVILDLV